MKENEPTQEQIREFWEWCGFRWVKGTFTWGLEGLLTPAGDKYAIDDYPPIDLNNLFKYAVPKLIYEYGIGISVKVLCFGAHRTTYLAQTYQVAGNKPLTAKEADDPALALFWALWQVKEKQ